jgi:ribonuclease PH
LGRTWVVCTATVEEKVPQFLYSAAQGWITAEYDMLPRATHNRRPRAATSGQASGRSQEIQRLIGRSLRAVVDLRALGERTIILDCDVLQADGGTRTAAITGAFVALCQALAGLQRQGTIAEMPVLDQVAAVSVGRVNEHILVDLDYQEDFRAEVDANFVVTGRGELVEVQATGEKGSFPLDLVPQMLELAGPALKRLRQAQEEALGSWMPLPW